MGCEPALATRPLRSRRFRPATCRRWGDDSALQRVARTEATSRFFARVARRAARERRPVLPISAPRNSGSKGPVCKLDDVKMSARGGTLLESKAVKPARQRGLPGRGAEALLALCPSFFRQAEQKAAPAFFNDLTESGCLSVSQAVARFPWQHEDTKRRAIMSALMLDLMPRRPVAGWACSVCGVQQAMAEDLNPMFRRVRREAFELHNIWLSYVPSRGKFGWRRRARWAGLRLK